VTVKRARKSCFAVALLSCLFLRAEGAPPSSSKTEEPVPAPVFQWRQEPNRSFDVGESILYVVKYGFIPAGFATLQIKAIETINGRPCYYILSKAITNKAVDVFYRVRDRNKSWMDVQSLCSQRFQQELREGFYRSESVTLYDQPALKFEYRKVRKGKESIREGGIPPFVQDVLSSLYYIRTRPLEVGKTYELDANSGGKTWPLSVHVKEIEKVRVPAGKFECLHLEPILAGEGIFQQAGHLEVWVTNDERKIPVLLRSRVMVGAFDAEMKRYISSETDGGGLPGEEKDMDRILEEEIEKGPHR